ncbi:histidine--tRNA ligase [Patescibacteria group bacterium]|nr:histidine--tRNA ligase [Patescibacteria group bacterium]
MEKIKPKILKGFRDYLPEKMILRKKIIEIVREVYERFGFEPLQTPALEYAETLLGKYGEESDTLLYQFRDYGGRGVGLRYDLTVPLARVMAMYPELPKPFKRYQLAPVWRAEKPQKGRFREFIQFDPDIVGTSSMMADAEIINLIYETMKALGFKRFVIQINNRKILDGFISKLGINKNQSPVVFRILDKLEKIGIEEVRKELVEKGLDKETVKRFLRFIQIKGNNQEILTQLKELLSGNSEGIKGIEELGSILGYSKEVGIPEENLKINLALVRGLDYYTGPVFETIISDCPEVGSVFGGGRYDNLMGMFCEKEIPAVGVSIGIDRIFSAMDTLKMFPNKTAISQVLVTVFDKSTEIQSLKLTNELRKLGINTEIYLGEGNLSKQFRYANKKNISFVIIIGSAEIKENKVTLKNMATGEQKTIKNIDLIKNLKALKL